jgi:hypothetical protein
LEAEKHALNAGGGTGAGDANAVLALFMTLNWKSILYIVWDLSLSI